MSISDVIWFSEGTSVKPIGVVIKVDEVTGEPMAYIGTGNGASEDDDIRRILAWGAKFHKSTLELILSKL